MARRRREILKQLEEEGVLTLNKELEIPLLAQRIAVISSATAAGYGDFVINWNRIPMVCLLSAFVSCYYAGGTGRTICHYRIGCYPCLS